MKNNWLEKGLNDKLGDYGSPIDLDEAWKALEAKRQPKKKRFLWAWLTTGLLFFINLGGYFIWENGTHESISQSSNALQIEKSSIINFPESANIIDNTKNNNNTISKINSYENLSNQSSTKNLTSFKNDFSNKISTKKSGVRNDLDLEPSTPNYFTKNNQDTFQKENKDFSLANTSSRISKSLIQSSSDLPLLSSVEILFLNSLSEYSIFNFSDKLKTETDKTILFKKPRPAFPSFLGLATGYGMRSKGKVTAAESTIDMISIDLFYGKYFTKNFYLKTGITFDQFTNKLQVNATNSDFQNLDNQLITVNEHQNGDIEYIYGPADVEIIEKSKFEVFNKYRFVSIPVIFGLEIFPSKRSSFQIEGGIATSIYGKHTGKLLANNNTEIFNNIENEELKKSGIFNGRYGLQWNYAPLKNRDWKFFIKYQGSFHLNKVNDTEALDVERFRSNQLFIGLKHHFYIKS